MKKKMGEFFSSLNAFGSYRQKGNTSHQAGQDREANKSHVIKYDSYAWTTFERKKLLICKRLNYAVVSY